MTHIIITDDILRNLHNEVEINCMLNEESTFSLEIPLYEGLSLYVEGICTINKLWDNTCGSFVVQVEDIIVEELIVKMSIFADNWFSCGKINDCHLYYNKEKISVKQLIRTINSLK